MKILITIPRKTAGGVANYFLTIKKYFNSDVEYLPRGAKEKNTGPLDQFWRLLFDYLLFLKKIVIHDIKLVHINTSFKHRSIKRDLVFIFLSRIVKRKIVLFIHGWDEDYEKRFWKRNGFVNKIFRLCDAYIVLSNDFKNTLKKKYKISSTIYTLSTVVDDTIITQNSIKSKFGDPKKLLYLSRIEKEKGIFESIDTFKILNTKYPNSKFVIAGNGSQLLNAKKYVERNNMDNVVFLGFVTGKEKDEVYRESDIYLFPSYGEGMPTTVLEAMAWGLPVITRPVGGLKDFFENGKMGYMTESKSAKDFANLIFKLIENEKDIGSISAYNIDYAKKNFTASKVAGRIEDIYRSLMPQANDRTDDVYNEKP